MRLLLVADLHYSLPQFDWVLDYAADFDVVVMAGDHLDLASLVDGRAQSVVVRKYFERLRTKTRVLICSGNHDLDAKNEAGEKFAKWLSGSQPEGVLSDGESIVIDKTLFTACPWWDGPIVKAGISAQLAEASTKRPERWIWLHHASLPPVGAATGISAMSNLESGSSSTGRTWFSPATCISRRSSRTAHGSIGSGRPGCSTPGSNSALRRPI
jgi:hypothetical protein